MLENVADSNVFFASWQNAITSNDTLQHPAVIHNLPDDCLCRALTAKHAGQISAQAGQSGFYTFQILSNHPELGKSVDILDSIVRQIAPVIIITNAQGRIAYVGAYSDGIRCNTGTSLVSRFIASPEDLPAIPVVGLDVKTCRCAE
nr:DUF6436 domain-containing protein [Reinekea sp. G2M2-21]